MDAHGPGSSPDHVIADRGWRRWFGLAFLALALIGLWQVPWLGWLVYPFRVFGTFVHELSHGLAAIATGGDFVRFAVSPDLSGVAHSAGGLRMIVASAGYIGSAVFGGALLVLHARLLSSRTLLFGLGVVFGLLCLLFVRNLFGVAAALGSRRHCSPPRGCRGRRDSCRRARCSDPGSYNSLFTVHAGANGAQRRHTMAN
jgi:MFS family permease